MAARSTDARPPASGSRRSRAQLRAPRLAEMVAEVLRERIVTGELPDGGKLPRQEDLLEEFNVSKPSMREALRILETEGLISVRRGKLGGAIVHAPQSHDAAYMLGLVLQAKHVAISDVGAALLNLEPACAVLCTERPDRDTILPKLRAVHDEGVAMVDVPAAFAAAMRRFHEAIVDHCGNETMQTVVGSLEALWSSKETEWLEAAASSGAVPSRDMRLAALKDHARMLTLMEKGDADGITRVSYRHQCITQSYALAASSPEEVDAAGARRASGS
jgi:GntR family transcriptional repressor for pyruvate dehydrogenase complex